MFFFSIRHCPLFTISMLLPYTVPSSMLYSPSTPPPNSPSTPLSPFLSYSSFLLFFSLPSHFLPSPPCLSGTCLAINEIAPRALCLLHSPPNSFVILLSPLLLFFSTHAILPCLSMAFLSAQCTGNFSARSGNYRVSYVVQGNNVTFSVSARTTGWVAIGVSNDNRMVSYVFCRQIISSYSAYHCFVLVFCKGSLHNSLSSCIVHIANLCNVQYREEWEGSIPPPLLYA